MQSYLDYTDYLKPQSFFKNIYEITIYYKLLRLQYLHT